MARGRFRRSVPLGSAVLLILASISLRNPTGVALTLLLWGAGVALPLTLIPPAEPDRRGMARWAIVSIVGLLIAATLIRTWRLDAVPAYVHGDAAVVALESISVRESPHRRFFAAPDTPQLEDSFGWYGLPNSTFYLQGIGLDLFGQDLIGARAGSVIYGMASLAGHAVLAWSLFGPQTAVLSLIPLTAYHWHLFLSRSGHAYVQATFFATWSLALLALGLRRRSSRSLYLCGVLAGLSMLSVFAARIVPVILATFALTELLARRSPLRDVVRRFGVVALGGAAAIAPAVPGLIIHWETYVGHTRDVSVFSEHIRTHLSKLIGSDSLAVILWSQIWSSLRIFLFGIDGSSQYGFEGRFLDPLLIGFAIVGLLVCLLRWSNAAFRLPLLWFSLTFVLGAVLTVDAPSMSRLPPLVTLPYLFAAVGMVSCVDSVRKSYGARWARALSALMIALCLGAAWWNLDQFFRVYPQQRPAERVTLVARLLAEEEPDVEVRMLTVPDGGVHLPLLWDHGTLRLFNQHRTGKDVADLREEIAVDSPPRIFVLFEDRSHQLAELQAAFPDGTVLPAVPALDLILFRTRGGSP